MRSNYKKLGKYIQEVNIKNKDLEVEKLLGVSITKKFIPSIANTVGTDMSTYKIVKKNQFAYGPVTSRNGDKISVALLSEDDCIISTSYTVFEIIDKNELDPEYLMMWFTRLEFDRYARYMSHGSVREIFGWEEMCDVELPVPSIKKQLEIVKEYNTIVNRINLNEQLNQKLEETAQAIYKQWFVDFEFPDSKGLPYKSNGGEMIFNEELEQEIPKGWEAVSLEKLVVCNKATLNKNDKFDTILYLDTSSITNNKITEFQILDMKLDEIPSRARRKVEHNDIIYSTVRPNLKHFGVIKKPVPNTIVSTGFAVLSVTKEYLSSELVYLWLTQDKMIEYLHSKAEMSVSTYPSIRPEDLLSIKIPLSQDNLLQSAAKILRPIYDNQCVNNQEINLLENFKNILLSSMPSKQLEAVS